MSAPALVAELRGYQLWSLETVLGHAQAFTVPTSSASGPSPTALEWAAASRDYKSLGWQAALAQARATGNFAVVQAHPAFNPGDLTSAENARVAALFDALHPSEGGTLAQTAAGVLRGLPAFAPAQLLAVPGLGPLFAAAGAALQGLGGAAASAARSAGAIASAPTDALAVEATRFLPTTPLPYPAAAAVALDPSEQGLEATAAAQGALVVAGAVPVVGEAVAVSVGAGTVAATIAGSALGAAATTAYSAGVSVAMGRAVDAAAVGLSLAQGALSTLGPALASTGLPELGAAIVAASRAAREPTQAALQGRPPSLLASLAGAINAALAAGRAAAA